MKDREVDRAPSVFPATMPPSRRDSVPPPRDLENRDLDGRLARLEDWKVKSEPRIESSLGRLGSLEVWRMGYVTRLVERIRKLEQTQRLAMPPGSMLVSKDQVVRLVQDSFKAGTTATPGTLLARILEGLDEL